MTSIRGAGGGSKPKTYTPKEAKDNLNSTEYATVLDLISEGEIQGLKNGNKSIFIDGTPLQNEDGSFNFQGVNVQTRNGTQNQSALSLVSGTRNQIPVGVTALFNVNITRTITNSDVDAIVITIICPALQEVTDKGDINGSEFTFIVEVQYGTGGSWEQELDERVRGRSGDEFSRSYTINLDETRPFPVSVRLRRTNVDSTDVRKNNAFNWSSYTEVIYNRLAYPNSALVALRVDASQFSSVPDRAYLIRGIKVRIPNNATVNSTNGRLVYSGIWNGNFGAAQWTTDPAWILWDLLTSKRYGLGDHLDASQLDKWAFYSASQYCSALVPSGFGGTEPRFSCNVNIQTQQDAYRLINDMASVFRAMPYWSAGSLTISQDRPTDPACLFTLANVTEEGFRYESGSLKNRPTVAIVGFFNITKRDIDYQVVEDRDKITRYGVVTREVTAFACTSRGQAQRVGEWLLYSEWNESEVVSFTTALAEGVQVRPGQIIEIADPVRAGVRRGGRIASATTTSIRLDSSQDINYAAGSTISVILPDGTVQSRPVNTSTSGGATVNVTTPFTTAPNANSIWIFETPAIQATTWRVLTVQEQDGVNYAVTAVAHNPSKYNFIERDQPLIEPSVTLLNEVPSPPSSINAREALYENTGKILSKLIISWPAVLGVNTYRVRWRFQGGSWNQTVQNSLDYEIQDAGIGVYEIEVYSIRAQLIPSALPARLTYSTQGKLLPPSNVTGFTAFVDPNLGATLRWNPVPDLDLAGYEIWEGVIFGNDKKLGLFQTTSIQVDTVPNNATTWTIKALDTSGRYSANAASATATVSSAPAPAVTGSFKADQVELSWTAVSGSLTTQFYEIRYGASFGAGVVVASVQGTTFSTKAAWTGQRTWFVAAVDTLGGLGAAGSWQGVIQAPSQPSITQQVVDNNVLLRWNDCTRTLPVTGYELRRGATWAGATVIGVKQGTFTSVFEVVSGTYTYWLAGIDSAGNVGTPGSVAAVVNQPPDYQLQSDSNSNFAGSKSNVVVESGILYGPVNTTETFEQHFTSRSWTTLQDHIDAGYTFYALPSATSASYEETIDLGSLISSSKVTATLTRQTITGTVTATPTISVRATTGDVWTDYAGVTSVFASNFRYVKTLYQFSATDDKGLMAASSLNVRLETKLRNDFGNGTAAAADSGGTTVTFNVAFLDVQAISVTPLGTSAVIAVYDFVDTPNPTTFKVLLFDTAGNRVSGPFSWSARGV
jgi:predicted phage tail protein